MERVVFAGGDVVGGEDYEGEDKRDQPGMFET